MKIGCFYSLFVRLILSYTLDSCGMRKKTAEFQSFFIVIAFVLMTSNVIKSFVQRRNVRRFSLSSGPLQSLHHISSHTANRKHFSSSIDSNDVMSYLNHPPNEHEIHALSSFLSNKRNVCVITGAGVSTSSGIPDYRGPQGSYKLGHKPMVPIPHTINLIQPKLKPNPDAYANLSYPIRCTKTSFDQRQRGNDTGLAACLDGRPSRRQDPTALTSLLQSWNCRVS